VISISDNESYKSVIWLWILLIGVVTPGRCGIALSEDFVDINSLAARGWVMINHSQPLGISNWFQGDSDNYFAAPQGPPDSYIAADYYNVLTLGTISNWLILPKLTLHNGDSLTFYTRSDVFDDIPDRLEVRFSANGASTNVGSTSSSVGDFTRLLQSINPTLVPYGYPSFWEAYTVTLSGLPGTVDGRFAFRYFVTDAGTFGTIHGDYIGIDAVAVNVASPAPEPFSLTLTAPASPPLSFAPDSAAPAKSLLRQRVRP
jgi:hypothetical protein